MPQDEVSCTSAVREREVRQLMGAIRFLRTADWQSSLWRRFLNPGARPGSPQIHQRHPADRDPGA
jgi:hypothetical protein